MKTYIYTLDCPISGTIKYVGKTINTKQRLGQHIRCKENTKKYAWIKGLKNIGLKPIMTVVDSYDSNIDFWENWYIEYYKFIGFDLKNHKGGGVGGRLSKETKEKISFKLKGKKKSEEHRLKAIKNLNTGTPWNKGKKLNESNKAKAIKSINEYRLNNEPYWKNKKRTEETKEKIKKTFKDKYGWVKKQTPHDSMEEYNNFRCKIVVGINENNKVIINLKDSVNYGFNSSNIINCINGKRKTAYGYSWEYFK